MKFNQKPFSNCTIVVADPQDPTLNVRAEPGTKGEILGELSNGTNLSVVDQKNGWFKIDSPLKGWVAGNRTKITCK